MSVDPLGITPIALRGNPRETQQSDSAAMGRDEFLKLLVTQLSNQDPMNPLEGQEFAAQLAQFTSVEALVNIEQTLAAQGDMNAVLAQSMNNGVAAGLIGQAVEAPGNGLNWDGDVAATGGFFLENDAASVSISIRDASGVLVRTIDLSSLEEGSQSFEWDGTSDTGARVKAGAYTAEVTALDDNGDAIASSSSVRGTVSKVTFSPEGVFLWIGHLPVSMSDIESVGATG
jgi:flagellar basal-body rod modification protein FlgD